MKYKVKIITTMNTVLMFKDGDLFKQITYRNKTMAKNNYKIFLKYGFMDYMTGDKIENLTFELI